MSSAPKFIFECLESSCPDRKCCNRSPVMVYFEDIRRWIMDQSINIVYPNIEFTMAGGFPMMVLRKYPNETLCAMFNKETNKCNIYFSKPLNCATFPLGFNGNSFYIMEKCAGLGKGAMTKESLKEMRKQAKLDFECRMRTSSTLPLLQGLFLQFFQKQSQEAMQSMSEEDRKKLMEEMLKKEQQPAEAKTDTPPETEAKTDTPPETEASK